MSADLEILIPFTVPSEKRESLLSKKMELATIFCLAELGRDKGGGLISKRPCEETFFISKLYYPLWLIPWKRKTLIFDGLGITSHVISFDVLPNLGIFMREIKGSANNLEAYSAFLSHNMNYFKVVGKGQKVIKGLIADPKFTEDLLSLLPIAESIQDPPKDGVSLLPLMDKPAVQSSLNELSNFEKSLKKDIKDLQRVVKMLVEKTQNYIDEVNRKIEETRRKYENELASLKPKYMRRIEAEGRKHSERIAEVSRKADHLIQVLSQKKLDLEMDKKHLDSLFERYKNEMEEAKSRGDKAEEELWRKKLEKCKQDLLKVSEKIKEINRNIENAKSVRDQEISRLKSEYSSKIESIAVGLRKIEASRDFQIQTYQETVKSLEELTQAMLSQVNKLIDLRKLTLNELEKIACPVGKRRSMIIHLPFFLTCYKRGLERRYVVFPPSVVSAPDVLLKIKGAFKSFKIRMLLKEYSAPITNLLNRFVDLVEQNLIFGEKVREECVKMDILKKFRKEIIEGLEELCEEKWLSEKEVTLLCKQGSLE